MLINITLPVYNEEKVLARSVHTLENFLKRNLKHDYEIVIADNGSTDNTIQVAESLVREYRRLKLLKIKKKGRGRAIKKAWSSSSADILSFMDIDLSTDLRFFPRLIDEIRKGADLAYGSRLKKGSRTTRSFFREVLSRGYNLLVKLSLGVMINDTQCGFKAIKKDVYEKLRPYLHDNEWFFDTEMLVFADYEGFRLAEVPVRWVEDGDSKVDISDTIITYLRKLMKLRRRIR